MPITFDPEPIVSDDNVENVVVFGDIEPKITAADPDVDVEVRPPVVTQIDGTLNWASQQNKTLCGETIVGNAGDNGFRVVLEGLIYYHQLEDLMELRERASELMVVTALTSKIGASTLSPDKLKLKRTEDVDTVTTEIDGTTVREPAYQFQFQKKEQENGGIFN